VVPQHPAGNSAAAREQLAEDQLGLSSAAAGRDEKDLGPPGHDEHARPRRQATAVRKERDDAVAALLSPSEKSAYEKVQQDYSNKLRALGQERSKAYEAAVEKTKIYSDAQAA